MRYTPKISVLIPIYNVEKYLGECLESLSLQTLSEIEIICINDGSTDNSLSIARSFAQKDSRFRIVDKSNSGYGDSLNKGIEVAKGKYLAIVDSDDYIDHRMYEKLYQEAVVYDAEIVKCGFFEFYDYEHERRYETKLISRDKRDFHRVICPRREKKYFYYPMMNPLAIFSSKFIRENRIVHNTTPGASHQDMGFWFQTLSFVNRLVFINEPLYYYRQTNPNSSIHARGTRVQVMYDEYDFILEKMRCRPEIFQEVLDVFSHRKFLSLSYFYYHLLEEYKPLFLVLFKESFTRDKNNRCLDLSRFSVHEKKRLNKIIKDPIGYFVRDYSFRRRLWNKSKADKQSIFEKLAVSLINDGLFITLKKVFRYF